MTTTTTNYGWVKPDVGASDDVWGGYINTDLDGVDSVVKGVSVVANAAYPASNPSGYQTAAQVASVVIGDNRIINGNFAINQRALATGSAMAAGLYGHDRWKAGTGGCTYTFTAGVPDTTITITAGTLTQIIEGGMIEGGVYTLSWTGTAQARVYQGSPTGAYAASPLTTASLPAGINTIVEFNAGTLTRVKLEIGSVATPFNRQSLAKSMADCARYYLVVPQMLVGGATFAGVAVWAPLSFMMRAAPTAVFSGITYSNASNMHLDSASPTVANIAITGTSSAAVSWGQGTVALSAEL